ncbi:MAG: GTPase HflX [Gaiellaceae bacterium]
MGEKSVIGASGELERGLIASVIDPRADTDEALEEFQELLTTARVEVVGEGIQRRTRPDPRTYLGAGKLGQLGEMARASHAESLIVDDELTPGQQRRLEDTLKLRVIDRTQLILDIFAHHAKTAEGKLQVELAQLEYNLPRMRGMWQHLERLGGGIGTRGPGESQLETDRRLARRRISVLKGRLTTLSRQRATQRKQRVDSTTPIVALAGYTNVGKSTLLNALTDAEVSVRDRLFETLDPTTRSFEHEGRNYLVSDTVGFIRRLPHGLVEGFKATLEEMLAADLILHVVDVSERDERVAEMADAVDAVLEEIGADDLPIEIVLNKADLADAVSLQRAKHRFPGALAVAAATGAGVDELRGRIATRFAELFEPVRLLIPHADGSQLAELYALGAPIDERDDRADGVALLAQLPRREIPRFAKYLQGDGRPDTLAGDPHAPPAAG